MQTWSRIAARVLACITLCAGGRVALAAENPVSTETVVLTSSARQTLLLELYTSELCPACPPAGRWFSEFSHGSKLWVDFVPVAFHVPYWDRPNLSDRFARIEFVDRQQLYLERKALVSLRTPQFIVDGGEWETIMGFRDPIKPSSRHVGVLEVKLTGYRIEAWFRPVAGDTATVEFHIARLGVDIAAYRQPNSGEIARAPHLDFAVLDYQRHPASVTNGKAQWTTELAHAPQSFAGRTALAAWVSHETDPTPIQAVGGWVNFSATE